MKILYSTLLCLVVLFSATTTHAETYYFHNDHLGTPQVLTDENQTVVWKGEYDPFGEVTETVATVEQNLRFPGQYLDRESGLHYNYFRTYDPLIGRYTQSDPIGLGGGINTYGYAYQNPLSYTDPTGELVPQLFGFAIGAGLEYFTNECATVGDVLLAGALGALGGGMSKLAFLRFGPRSLTREHGKEWSHSIAKKQVNKYTNGSLNKAMNKRGGLNGSWTSPKRHYRHDAQRYPRGWRDFGSRLPSPIKAVDRIPDWAKGSTAAGIAGSSVAGDNCNCR